MGKALAAERLGYHGQRTGVPRKTPSGARKQGRARTSGQTSPAVPLARLLVGLRQLSQLVQFVHQAKAERAFRPQFIEQLLGLLERIFVALTFTQQPAKTTLNFRFGKQGNTSEPGLRRLDPSSGAATISPRPCMASTSSWDQIHCNGFHHNLNSPTWGGLRKRRISIVPLAENLDRPVRPSFSARDWRTHSRQPNTARRLSHRKSARRADGR